jgi:hypothetical protein
MSYFVLRQIHPPGKSALADAATATALALAAIQNQVHKGKYLEWSDPDANGGMGDERWTDDPAKARRFPSFVAALECWREQSARPPRPCRTECRPNRPLTAYSVMPERIE